MEDLGQIISTNLVFLRKNAGLTQLEFGEKFNYTDKTVSRWENGSIIPSVEILKQIADFYGVSLDYLVTEHKSSKEFTSTIGKTVNPKKKIIFIALDVTVIWLIAMTIFVASMFNLGTLDPSVNHWWSVFLWAVPASFFLMAFLTHRWFKNLKHTMIYVSCFVWTILLAAYLSFLYMGNYWYLFFIGIPIQVALILVVYLK